MKATVSNAIKAYDRTVKSHIRKIQAQQTVIDKAQNEIRNCQASIQTAQKGLVHQISAIVERRKDAGERYLGAHPVLSVPSVVQSITMIHNLLVIKAGHGSARRDLRSGENPHYPPLNSPHHLL